MAKRRGSTFLVVLVVLLIIAGAAGFFVWPFFEGQAPEIILGSEPTHIGKKTTLKVQLKDQGRGLKGFKVVLEQNGKLKPLLDQPFAEGSHDENLELTIEPARLGLPQGQAKLILEARDRSWHNMLHGSLTRREYQISIDTVPPRVRQVSGLTYLNRGGSAIAIYHVSEPGGEHGVTVGNTTFKGYTPWPDRPEMKLCYFAYADNLPKGEKITIYAKDEAGNQAKASPNVRVRWKKYRHDKLKLSQRFFDAVLPRFAGRVPADKQDGSAVEFTYINSVIRAQNNQAIYQASLGSVSNQMFQPPMSRPRGMPKAKFGDRRTYYFNGKDVGKSVHLGYDLADTARSPINAVAKGKVTFANDMGLYGNCVIIDHGLGISTLYAHLSAMDVKPGDLVERGGQLGLSGATGMALGDHLHLSVLVNGVFVNPAEWWDPHWVRDNIELHLENAGLPTPVEAAAAQ